MLSPQNKKIMLNAVCAGAVAGILTKYAIGEVSDVNYYGVPLSAPMAVSLGCGVGSVVSDLTHDMVIKRLAITNQIMNGATLAVQAGVGGLASASVLYFGGAPMSNMPIAFGVGAVSKLGGDYAQDKLFSPQNGIIGPIF